MSNTVSRSRLNAIKGYATIKGAQRALDKSEALTFHKSFGNVLRTEVMANSNGRFVPVAFIDPANGFQVGVILAHRGIFVTDREFA